ncbi:uncharacterized protein LOC131155889 [Malania oleifera]|uniref:uncharacterized protein LOC131155889 n=1 Tax=Malania oleifera TaxID=397392 RepID=UPI0025AE28DB|nr:uncharacterized protein LOC131155889 [Malania oleifera]
MNFGNSDTNARGDGVGPSSLGGRDYDAVLRSVMTKMARNSGERSYTIQHFTCMIPPSFVGGADTTVVENWVQDVEDKLVVLSCTNEQKVSFATSKLTGEAKRWWRSTSAKAAEFLHLTQGQMTVQQCATQFIELSRFASHLAPDEGKKARKCEEGLRQNVFDHVIDFRAQTFVKDVDRASVIESGM